MKKLLKNILVLAVMLGTCASYANATLEVSPTYSDVKKGNSISVTDATGEIVFSGQINFDGNIDRLYDFSQLKNGIYVIEIDKDYEIEISTVEVKNKSVNLLFQRNKKIYKPVFRVKDGRVIISKIALDIAEMEVELYFDNELIHTETVKGDEILNRVYKLDDNIKGDYTAVVKTNNRVFVKNFRI